MDFTTIILIIVVLAAIYLFIRLVVSPLIKAILGVIFFLVALYVLQKFFHFDTSKVFGPFATYVDITKWGINLDWLLNPLNYLIKEIISFFSSALNNIPKMSK